jgi:hypothetical protein
MNAATDGRKLWPGSRSVTPALESVGTHNTGELLVAASDNPDRPRSDNKNVTPTTSRSTTSPALTTVVECMTTALRGRGLAQPVLEAGLAEPRVGAGDERALAQLGAEAAPRDRRTRDRRRSAPPDSFNRAVCRNF